MHALLILMHTFDPNEFLHAYLLNIMGKEPDCLKIYIPQHFLFPKEIKISP